MRKWLSLLPIVFITVFLIDCDAVVLPLGCMEEMATNVPILTTCAVGTR